MTKPIAVQLYTLREALKDNFIPTIEELAATGYLAVEIFGGLPVTPQEAARIFAANGLQVASGHMKLPLGEDEKPSLETAATYGLQYYVIPWLPAENFLTLDSIKRVADNLNRANRIVQREGMRLAYHNHDFEFVLAEGEIAYDVLLQHLDPAITLEVDTYWVQVGGQNPVELVQRLGARAPLLHIKDGPADSINRAPMTAVGQGSMDVPAVVQAGGDHTEWLIAELDECATDMMTAVKESYTYLTQQGLAHGKS